MDDEVIREGLSRPTVIDQNNLHTILQNLSRTLSWRDNMRTLKCVGGHVAYGSKKNTTSKNILVRCELPFTRCNFTCNYSTLAKQASLTGGL
jgi:hypothetical protein